MLLSVRMLSRLNKSFQRQNNLSEPIGWSLLKHKWAIFAQDEASGISGIKVRKKANIRNRYNQIPHPTRTPYGKVTKHTKTSYQRDRRSVLSQQLITMLLGTEKTATKDMTQIT